MLTLLLEGSKDLVHNLLWRVSVHAKDGVDIWVVA